MSIIRTVIPAQPGFDIVELVDGEPNYLSYTPVVAWTVVLNVEDHDSDGPGDVDVYPVCHDFELNIALHARTPQPSLMRLPSGDICVTDGPTFHRGDEGAALDYLIKRN